jgi:cytochrome c oxidase cbb3-type subunit 2
MPSYPWLAKTTIDDSTIESKFKALKLLGVPYTDEDMAGAKAALKDKTEMDAVIEYLQNLGLLVK